MSRQKLALAALALMVSLSGCANIAVDVKVEDNSTIERYEVEAEVSDLIYSAVAEQARSEGHSGIDEMLRDKVGSKDAIGDFSYSETRDSGITTMKVVFEDVNVRQVDVPIDIVTLDDGSIWYEDRTFKQERAQRDTLRVNYTLTMPGEIVSSTTNKTDGRTAKWSYSESADEGGLRVSATSKPSLVEQVPGFTALTALSALLLSFLAVLGKHRQN